MTSIDTSPAVARWLQGYAEQWGGAEPLDQLDALAAFCTFVGKDPDELVAWLLREDDHGRTIRLGRRRELVAQLEQFEAEHGGRPAGNAVRSFLIHNGVAISATPL